MKNEIIELYEQLKIIKEEYIELDKQRKNLLQQEYINKPQFKLENASKEFQDLNTIWYNKSKEWNTLETKITNLLNDQLVKLPNGNYLVPIITEDEYGCEEFEEML